MNTLFKVNLPIENPNSIEIYLLNHLENLVKNPNLSLKLKWIEQFISYSYRLLRYYKNEPRIRYAFENLHLYPIDISKDDYELLIKVPGLSILVAKKLCSLREKRNIDYIDITHCGGKLYIAKHFICNNERLPKINLKSKKETEQLELF